MRENVESKEPEQAKRNRVEEERWKQSRSKILDVYVCDLVPVNLPFTQLRFYGFSNIVSLVTIALLFVQRKALGCVLSGLLKRLRLDGLAFTGGDRPGYNTRCNLK